MKNKKSCCYSNIFKAGAIVAVITSIGLIVKKALGMKDEKTKKKN